MESLHVIVSVIGVQIIILLLEFTLAKGHANWTNGLPHGSNRITLMNVILNSRILLQLLNLL